MARPDTVTKEEFVRTEKALRLVFSVILPRMNRSELGAPRRARPSYQFALVRNHAFFQDLARELGEWWLNLVSASQRADAASGEAGRRVDRAHMEDAAEEIIDLVRRMPRPVHDVVVRRASGMSWRQLGEALPDRVHFSLTDDWETAVRRVWTERGDCVRRLI